MLPERNRYPKKVFKYGTPEPRLFLEKAPRTWQRVLRSMPFFGSRASGYDFLVGFRFLTELFSCVSVLLLRAFAEVSLLSDQALQASRAPNTLDPQCC